MGSPKTYKGMTDNDLVRAAANDPRAADALYDRYVMDFVGRAWRIQGCYVDKETREDAYQEAFWIVFQLYNDRRGSFRGFLWQCFANRAVSMVTSDVRRWGREDWIAILAGAEVDPYAAENEALSRIAAERSGVQEAFESELDENEQEQLRLRIDGVTVRELAEMFDEKPGAIRRRLSRRKLAMRRFMRDHGYRKIEQ